MVSLRSGVSAAFSVFKSLHRSQTFRQVISERCYLRRPYSKDVYDGDSKTHALLLNDECPNLMINGYSEIGFLLNNDLRVIGPIAIFPNCVLSWNVGSVLHINEESLSLFFMLDPKPDVLILGIPKYYQTNRKAINEITMLVRKHKIQVEVLSSEMACPTFNFLSSEQRFVAAGIIPPLSVEGADVEAPEGTQFIGYANRT